MQPIIDAWKWDHFSWIWEPFIAKYPKLDEQQRIDIEDALVENIFEGDTDFALKSLGIAEQLYRQGLSSNRPTSLVKVQLSKQIDCLNLNNELSYYYILAFSTYEILEAIPYLKGIIAELERQRENGNLDESKTEDYSSYNNLLWAACIALLQLRSKDAWPLMFHMLDHDRRMGKISQQKEKGLTSTAITNFWEYIGVKGLRAIIKQCHDWSENDRLQVCQMLYNTLIIKKEMSGWKKFEIKIVCKRLLRVNLPA